MKIADYTELTNHISYDFKNINLLYEALCHSSFINEQEAPDLRDNERFEFLGDAVLNLAIGHLLMEQNPEMQEGDLSRIRSNLVNESQLATIARQINLGNYIQLGKGELNTQGQEKDSILANTLEAVFAAIYLDAGFEIVRDIISYHFSDLLKADDVSTISTDYKSQLQELVQATHQKIPTYTIIGETGPDHDKTFTVSLQAMDITAIGSGKSKKTAEQAAAQNALELITKKNDPLI